MDVGDVPIPLPNVKASILTPVCSLMIVIVFIETISFDDF
jgi:hypothetical protein